MSKEPAFGSENEDPLDEAFVDPEFNEAFEEAIREDKERESIEKKLDNVQSMIINTPADYRWQEEKISELHQRLESLRQIPDKSGQDTNHQSGEESINKFDSDPDLQAEAEQVAREYFQKNKKKPTKSRVANLLFEKGTVSDISASTIERRIRKAW